MCTTHLSQANLTSHQEELQGPSIKKEAFDFATSFTQLLLHRILAFQHTSGATWHVHSHCVTCLKMQLSISLQAFLLSYITLSQAIAIPQSVHAMSTATGYKNVAYFVNWVSYHTGAYLGTNVIPS